MDTDYGAIDTDMYNPVPTSSSTDMLDENKKLKSKNKYPYSVIFILSNEFCERFSFYGMRAILVLYLTSLSMEENAATSMFHAFSMLCYLMPLVGAAVADGYFGKYRTILFMSSLYFIGQLVLSLTALPPQTWIGPSIGLFLIACGTGGIKASVAPFGAEQFGPGQEKWQNSYFSAFYFMINLGSMIAMIVTPVLRADVQCFGDDCYVLAFGVPAILIFIALVTFFAGRNFYKKIPPSGNIIEKTFRCIYYGAKGRLFKSEYEEERSHWLYYADDIYDNTFIEDVRGLLKLLLMFLPLPIFWALNDQQGSRWTLQAQHMDGDIGIFGYVKPDQVQALNPILVLIMIPLFDNILYPLLNYCKVPNRPLQRMVFGLYISSLAFVCAGLVQLNIDKSQNFYILENGKAGVTLINTLPCTLKIQSTLFNGDIDRLKLSGFLQQDAGNYSLIATTSCQLNQQSTEASFVLILDSSYRLVCYRPDNDSTLTIKQFPDQRNKPRNGKAALSVFTTATLGSDLDYLDFIIAPSSHKSAVTEDVGIRFNISQYDVSEFVEFDPMEYSIYVKNMTTWVYTGLRIKLKTAGVYTAFIGANDGQVDMPLHDPDPDPEYMILNCFSRLEVTLYVDVEANMVSIFWLIPQYVLITVSEVLFSISGLSFAYSQAPTSLTSVVQAIWLLTVSVGDLVVIIIANIQAIPSQTAEFFLFACLMFLDTIVFMIMAMHYTYKPNSLYTRSLEDTTTPIEGQSSDTELLPLHSMSSLIATGK